MKTPLSIDFKIGTILAMLVAVMGIVSLFYTPYDYNEMEPSNRFISPRVSHLMGTDNFGRDVFSRIMIGGRYTLAVSLLTVLGSAGIGASLGLVSGYIGGIWDEIVMRLMDGLSSFPGILSALVMIALLENSPFTLIIALLILFIPSYVRILRSGMLQYKNADFVKTATIMGASHVRIIFVHILPNLTGSLLSSTVLGLSNAILAEATMSYLGLGIQPPIPSWGRMLSESQNFLFNAPWCALAPGIMIMLTVIAFHYIGEGIRQIS
ncbi:MAG: ABC transporter permease [Treponema sp.]|jgi:peptide/nickel transport system permease protein|nr:ABC transporter permease [Treponema sp.]